MSSTWAVVPSSLPAVIRRCYTCPSGRYRPSGRFRVNANHKLLDVWLLALCAECGETVKFTVMERTSVRRIPPDLLTRLHDNDLALTAELLLDPALRHRNNIALDWTGAWRLDADPAARDASRDEAVEVTVRNTARIPVRPVRLIAEGLGLTRTRVETMLDEGRIVSADRLRGKLTGEFSFTVKR
ncbi:DUF1062 domain-containing protein [Streptomyces sp. NPDC051940]|uniref:DUF1062 domain-containing protein n=1 Tax=Streptomyces sp. NPDC051940 TaxID=3155675 RepID=UPI00341CBE2E